MEEAEGGCGYRLALVVLSTMLFNSTVSANRIMCAATFAATLRRYKNTLDIE
jgi:hypothetical protein